MNKSVQFTAAAILVLIALGGPRELVTLSAESVSGQEAAAPATPEEAGLKAPSDYVIGAEDVLGVLVWREEEMSGDVTVRSDGMITLPLVGDLRAAGLRPEELAERIEELSAVYLTDPNVTVIARQINSRKVFITGEVSAPGAYSLSGPLTVTQLLALAGGLAEWADQEDIRIMRVDEYGRATAIRFNYKWIKEGKRLDQNILLRPGDTVVVP